MADKAPTIERVRVTKDAGQTISDITVTDISLQTELVDEWGGHASSDAHISDDGAGYYLVVGQVQFTASAGGDIRHVELYHNADGIIAVGRSGEVGAGDTLLVQVSTVYQFSGSQNVRMRAYHDAGGGLNVDATSTWLEMIKL